MIQFFNSHIGFFEVILFCIALLVSALVYPYILKIALKFNIVDNPDARKLQRTPVPVMGGYVVFCGVVLSLYISQIYLGFSNLTFLPLLFLLMLVIGGIDDIRQLPPMMRFVVEIGVVCALVFFTGIKINDFHGLFGIDILPPYVSIPLSIFAGVGIINAINIIDGVDGFSSGYCIMACSVFAIIYSETPHATMMTLAVVCAGALIPFYLHNVFGDRSKMFIGDSGTMFMGTVMAVLVFRFLSDDLIYSEGPSPVPFACAIMAVPVLDTIRVMFFRILRHKSPFLPDKTHIHHAFISIGFSHSITSTAIIFINFLVVAACWLAYRLGAGANAQFAVVCVLGVLSTFVLYPVLNQSAKRIESGRPLCWFDKLLVRMAEASHIERKGFWGEIRKALDRKSL